MSDAEYLYPYDDTGTSPDNLIPAEQHVLTDQNGDNYHFIVPRVAPYYKGSLVVTHVETGTVLKPGLDFTWTHQYMAASAALAVNEQDEEVPEKKVFGSITILNRKLSGNISLEYQALGGQFIFDERNLLEELTSLLMYPDTRTWEDITAVPAYFPPMQHEIHIDDLVGMDQVLVAIEQLTEAVKGNGEGNHMHPITHIKGLQEILRGVADNAGNHKHAPNKAAGALINHTGAVAILLPEFAINTRVLVKVVVLSEKEPTEFQFSGTVEGLTTANTGKNWINPVVTFSGYEHTKEVRMTYDLEDRPVIYIGSNETWADSMVVVTEVTMDGSLAVNYTDNWHVMAVDSVLGDRMPTVDVGLEEFKVDFSSTGPLIPWTVWLINSNSELTRPLPTADIEDGAEIIVRDSTGRCYENNATITGTVHNQQDLVINRNKAWCRLKYSAEQATWVIMEGHAGTIYQGDGSLYLPEAPTEAPVVAITDRTVVVNSGDVIVDASFREWIIKRISTADGEITLKDECTVGTIVQVDNVQSSSGTVTIVSETGTIFFEELPTDDTRELTGKGQLEILKISDTDWIITNLVD